MKARLWVWSLDERQRRHLSWQSPTWGSVTDFEFIPGLGQNAQTPKYSPKGGLSGSQGPIDNKTGVIAVKPSLC